VFEQGGSYHHEDMSGCRLQATPEGVQAFVEAGYGLSVHWGLYSINGRGECVLRDEQLPLAEYRQRLQAFNPTRFHAEEWADLMLESGQRFLLITAKHHDGFCLWDTALTDWKVTNTPLRRDVLAELAQALRERGLKLHLYYSLIDWMHPSYREDWPAYIAYYQGQIRELCTRFAEIGGVIFDGYWPRSGAAGARWAYLPVLGPWALADTYDLIHSLQPNAVVANNSHTLPQTGEDYQVWELDLPGANTAGFNTTELGDRPRAVWWNLNSGWAYAPRSHRVKSADSILGTMQQARTAQSVFLLNVGPRPYGDIHPEEQQALRETGARLRELQ
jgi:alpha-L-fucosidase